MESGNNGPISGDATDNGAVSMRDLTIAEATLTNSICPRLRRRTDPEVTATPCVASRHRRDYPAPFF
ncbi:hypothetical protein J6590_001732 [Homalodisca vitripennis]|nr:hypothetical protein J6590_001732 [Homalodisca vitripennis]